VRVGAELAPTVAAQVAVAVAPEHVHVFDAASGSRV
jgi:hypothetical protein